MIHKQRINELKSFIEEHVGEEVEFEVEKGKKRSTSSTGVISTASTNVFTVTVDQGQNTEHSTSFTYTELLTEHVEMTFTKNGQRVMK